MGYRSFLYPCFFMLFGLNISVFGSSQQRFTRRVGLGGLFRTGIALNREIAVTSSNTDSVLRDDPPVYRIRIAAGFNPSGQRKFGIMEISTEERDDRIRTSGSGIAT